MDLKGMMIVLMLGTVLYTLDANPHGPLIPYNPHISKDEYRGDLILLPPANEIARR